MDVLETGFLVLLVALLLFAGLTQFVLRNVFHTGILWLEPLSRYLVLWIAFAGATRAAAEERHIRIDLLPRLLNGKIVLLFGAFTSFSSAAICLILARSGFSFLGMEREFSEVAFLSVPTWLALAAIPLGFLLMAARMTSKGIERLSRAVRRS